MHSPELIVGIDGSPEGEEALSWAANEASRRQLDLLVLYVYDWHISGAATPVGAPFVVNPRKFAEGVVANAVARARDIAPDVLVRGEAVPGQAASTLISASARGGTLVVGNRGRGGFASLLLGSVSQQVALHAHGPVVVVRGRPDPQQGQVVVGVDGSAESQHALRLAFETAALRGTGVLAVRAYTLAVPVYLPDVPTIAGDPEERHDAEQVVLADDVAPWAEKYPDIHVGCAAIEGHAGEVLIGQSATARLVVVGNRGHGGFSGLLVGSVGLQLLHHAECPVLIARAIAG